MKSQATKITRIRINVEILIAPMTAQKDLDCSFEFAIVMLG